MEQVIIPSDEHLMWRAHMVEGGICNEFNQNENGEFELTPFDIIQKNDDLVKFELVGMPTELYFNLEDGIFHVGEHTYDIRIIHAETKENLLEGKKNNLMMYRNAQREFTSNRDVICGYNYGYKIDSEYAHIKLRMTLSGDGYSFHAVITGKEDFKLQIEVIRDGEYAYLKPTEVEITKGKVFNLDM